MAENTQFDPANFSGGAPTAQEKNPLAAFFRQPKIYIRLPSKGKYWPKGALEENPTGEHKVFAMTARDELLFKTPDALMNGSAIVEVVKSCVPDIKDPWAMPSLDVDAVLCSIRMATYGEDMDVTAVCPKCGTQHDRSVDLRTVLDNLNQIEFAESVDVNGEILVHLRPMNYNEITRTALKAFEHQRIFTIINDDKIPEDEKVRLFQESFVKLTDLTLDTAVQCVVKVETAQGSTDNPVFIKEFLQKTDKGVFSTINDAVSKSQDSGKMASFDSKCDNCGNEWKVALTLDQADFFGNGFRRSQ
jgi:hypothetical protein